MELWEVIWTCPYNTDYTLFIATAILLQERAPIIEQQMCFADILRVRKHLRFVKNKIVLFNFL